MAAKKSGSDACEITENDQKELSNNNTSLTATDMVGEPEGLVVGATLMDGEPVGCVLTVGDCVRVGAYEGSTDIVGAVDAVGEVEGAPLGSAEGTSVGDVVAKSALERSRKG